MDLKDVSTDALYAELKTRGHYVMVTVSADQILAHSHEENLGLTYNDAICGLDWIWKNYETAPDFEPMIDYAIEKAQELKGRKNA